MNTPSWSDKPTCKGWWWCLPDEKCEWFERYKNGLIVEAIEDDGLYDPDSKGLVSSVLGAMSGDCKGFTGDYLGDLFGRWYGPIARPGEEEGKVSSATLKKLIAAGLNVSLALVERDISTISQIDDEHIRKDLLRILKDRHDELEIVREGVQDWCSEVDAGC